jgi:hypothetical protein
VFEKDIKIIFFYILKIIFNINILKYFKNIKQILITNEKKNIFKIFLEHKKK